MKFSQMPYTRPDLSDLRGRLADLTRQFTEAGSYQEADALFRQFDKEQRHISTLSTLCRIRHTIDTRDAFYTAENDFWNDAIPQLMEEEQAWNQAMLGSPFRKDFAAAYGDLMFLNMEIQNKAFAPVLVPLMQQESDLTDQYERLLASAQVPFEGKTYTIPQMTAFKTDANDQRRLAAWQAEGQWYKDHQDQLDDIYDKLVHLRDEMGKKMGHQDYTQLGYYRMDRNCYDKNDVEKFRQAVVKHLVPVADAIYRQQAERLGKAYPMNFADNALEFRSGNPRPVGTADDILAQGKKFYDELSPETSLFFRTMLEYEVMDVLSKEGKAGGGYCDSFPDYGLPFIFANFNGTQGDVEVVTHEAGHAFAAWTNRDRIPQSTVWPSLEGCEVHSMSMEFFAWPWAEGFFGDDTRKFRYSHLASALTFIPYGTMVDHFQHLIYEQPEMAPQQRHDTWKDLLGTYMPWMKLDGEIPFYGQGQGWQRQLHIYTNPFYYIDYCLAQTVALQFWAMIQKDPADAWAHYMAYTQQGGSRTFTDLLAHADLQSPFDDGCLRQVCKAAQDWLANYDLTGIQ